MRVTNSMLVSNFMSDLNVNMNKISDLQAKMASGRKFAHISDDPVAVIYSRQARYKLERLEHYSANVDNADNWLTQVEAGTMEINEIIKKAYESCIDAATDIKNGGDKGNIAKYIGQLRDQVLQTLNTTIGDKFIFGGYNTTGYMDGGQATPPFTVDETTGNLCYNGVDLTSNDPNDLALIEELRKDVMSFDLAIGANFPVSINGIDVAFYGTDDSTDPPTNLNIYNLLSDMYDTLNNGEGAVEIDNYISDLQTAQNHIMGLTADLGGRANRIEILKSRYEQDEINYTQMLSDAEDIDFAEMIMHYKMAEAVYNASLAAGANIIQPTLMDFLR